MNKDRQKMNSMASSDNFKSKTVYLEILRIVAAFFVIVNHTTADIFLSNTPDSKTWWCSLGYFFISKAGVPIFLMISGTVLLSKNDDARKYLSRIFRIIIVILVFSTVNYVINLWINKGTFHIKELVGQIYKYSASNAYWYLYLYLGILLILPFLQILAAHMQRKQFQLFLILTVVVAGGYPIISHYFPEAAFHNMILVPIFSIYTAMLFLGYYLNYFVEIRKSYAVISAIVFIIGFLGEVLLTRYEYQISPSDYLFLEERTNLNIILTAAALFYLIKCIGNFIKAERISKIIIRAGSYSFGIYLLSDLFIRVFEGVYHKLAGGVHILIAVIIYQIAVFLSSMLVTVILKRIPYINKII